MPTFHLADFYAHGPSRSNMPPQHMSDAPSGRLSRRSFIQCSQANDSSVGVTISLINNRSRDHRTLSLLPYQTVNVGRSSRSEQKKLSANKNNALFDCPVVSRNHAELRVSGPYQDVTLTDRSSLHGTTVNGQRLTPGHNFTLQSGDVIKLGERVTRGDGKWINQNTTQIKAANEAPTTDTHEGVSVTFRRHEPREPGDFFRDESPSLNHFHVPSPGGDEPSDYDSEIESVHSDQNDRSSAQTTPEQPKIVHTIDLSQEDDDEEDDDDEYEPAVVPDSLSFSRAPQKPILIEDDLDDSERDEIIIETSHQPEHPLAFLDSEMGAEEDAGEEEDPALDMHPGSAWALRDRSSPQLDEQPTDLENAAADDSNFFTAPIVPSKPRYDPVRNSQPPPDEPKTSTNVASSMSASANPSIHNLYDFGANDNAPASLGTKNGSRWDVPPAVPAVEAGQFSSSVHPGWQSTSTPFGFGLGAWQQYDHNPQDAIAPAPQQSAQSNGMDQPFSSFASIASIADNKGKMSIGQIVEEQNDPTGENAEHTSSLDAGAASSSGTKRKADDIADSQHAEVETHSPKRVKSTPSKTASAQHAQHRRSRGRGTVRRIAQGAVTYGGSACLGAAATVAFLSSSYAQDLIDWLS